MTEAATGAITAATAVLGLVVAAMAIKFVIKLLKRAS
jgi:hypothetical protein